MSENRLIIEEKLYILAERAARDQTRAIVFLYVVFMLGFLLGPAYMIAGVLGLTIWALCLLILTFLSLWAIQRSRWHTQGVTALLKLKDLNSIQAGVIRAEYFNGKMNLWLGRPGR